MRIKNIEKQKNVFIEYVFFLKKLKFVEVNLNNNGSENKTLFLLRTHPPRSPSPTPTTSETKGNLHEKKK